ncbi:MAG: hypothetical protein H0S77_01235 [Spirochaetaceae bacterium]|jgi:hypothetical protein|nr:hypothetical protein [Spirochaetaceae bacterium]
MKRRTTILSTASVFFIALILFSSCGIATRFYIDSKIAPPTADSGIIIPPDSVMGIYKVNADPLNNLDWIEVGTGPSLMLFYLITDKQNPPSSIISTFNSKYQQNYAGMAISSDEVLTVTDDNINYTLFRFSDDQGTEFKSPYYIASAVDHNNPDFSCTLTKKEISESDEYVYMNLVFDPTTSSYTIHQSSKLYRYNAQPFETKLNTITTDNNPDLFKDYHLGDEPSDMYLHIYAAVNVSGSFNNIYWTDLAYLGHIPL